MIQSKSKKRDKPNIEEITQCPECGGTHLTKDYSRAELVCEECGLVIDCLLYTSPSPRDRQKSRMPSSA